MREIKFRGKPIDGREEWVYGHLIENGGKSYIFCGGYYDKLVIRKNEDGEPDTYLIPNLIEIHPWSVGQCHSEPDCYGNSICEGDIILEVQTNQWGNLVIHEYITGEYPGPRRKVKTIREEDAFGIYGMKLHSRKVIGNVYDNLELLQQV